MIFCVHRSFGRAVENVYEESLRRVVSCSESVPANTSRRKNSEPTGIKDDVELRTAVQTYTQSMEGLTTAKLAHEGGGEPRNHPLLRAPRPFAETAQNTFWLQGILGGISKAAAIHQARSRPGVLA
jgi:hypothetical protein